jgi:UDP-N-acetylglucosamine 1-carboxyvinyltransferase
MTEVAWRIEGGTPLRGTVRPSGSKNGSLPLLAASLLLDGQSTLTNIPRIADVETMLALLRAFGLTVEERPRGEIHITNNGLSTHLAPADLVGKMRASHYLLGPVLLHRGRVEMAMPGGCDLGARPVTHITSVLEALGATAETKDTIHLSARGLRGAVVTLDPRHRNPGATFTGLMAGALATGETTIENASFEPDVVGFCRFLGAAGARITGIGTPTLTIQGVDRLHGAAHRVNSDRLEAGTFLCAAVATRGDVAVEDTTWDELGETADKLAQAGVELLAEGSALRARCPGRPRGMHIITDPFPCFSTDLQPPVAAVLATADGESTIRETVFDRRLRYADELVKMGADIELRESRFAVIRGVPSLRGARIAAGNIRDGAALVIAALGAQGQSLVAGRNYVARGYEDFETKLRSLGAEIELVG